MENLANQIIEENKALVEHELDKKYNQNDKICGDLYEAQKYSLMMGGKRIRPTLCIEACKMFGGSVEAAMPFAVALEMVHNYSLIHDDLPCMDNDDLRRGMPTTHKKFGEATAILAGDGLLTDAFLECAMNPYVSGDCAAAAVSLLALGAGSQGMVKGQAIDLYGEQNPLTSEELVELHLGKTGALICASIQLGCLAAGITPDDERVRDMTMFGEKIGLVFQIVDDVLDVTSTESTLGKPIGSDAEQNKTTFMSFFSPEEGLRYAELYTKEAIAHISQYENSERMAEIAKYLCRREK